MRRYSPYADDSGHTAALRDGDRLPASADRWLRSLASRSMEADNPSPPERLERIAGEAIRMSADWSALIGRHGAAFLGLRPDQGEGDFYEFAMLQVRSVHLDALLLGMVQRDHLDALADELSMVFDGGPGLAWRVASVEQNIAGFRSTYWRQHQTVHGPAGVCSAPSRRSTGSLSCDRAGPATGHRLVRTPSAGRREPVASADRPRGCVRRHSGALTTRYGRLVLVSLRGGTGR
ncbi:hypothetical protein G5C60_21780 [Streptomyces sp. HC44]|uniref:Uncharacterized protein n=1 Tax=Streptomyces scabichelini TaxID=2711217 RepID=A0A6G4V7X8_9ACTN|nr:hypothetical protein [Streptomyces scabichelini]NGO10146.1 hypothetical protein [Streptomyces scabichelini]